MFIIQAIVYMHAIAELISNILPKPPLTSINFVRPRQKKSWFQICKKKPRICSSLVKSWGILIYTLVTPQARLIHLPVFPQISQDISSTARLAERYELSYSPSRFPQLKWRHLGWLDMETISYSCHLSLDVRSSHEKICVLGFAHHGH